MNKNIVGVFAGIIIIGGASFYGGDVYGKSQTPASSARAGQFAGGAGGARTGARGAGGGFTSGQIVSVASGSVTVKMASGSTQIVLMSGTTQILKSTAGSASDLGVGTTVTITGSANSDGSLTAQSIQIRPAGMPARGAATPPAGQ